MAGRGPLAPLRACPARGATGPGERQEYENALMMKRFLFEAFDCYISLFYLAFVQVRRSLPFRSPAPAVLRLLATPIRSQPGAPARRGVVCLPCAPGARAWKWARSGASHIGVVGFRSDKAL